jgi:prephenate dehydrogenase
MYSVLNMNILYMNSESHDMHAAYVSHISHISSFALALTVLDIEKNEHNILNLASGGFDSTVRLAKSSAKMWNPIFKQNSKNVLNVIENYINILNQFKVAIKSDNDEMLIEMINKANTIKLFLK